MLILAGVSINAIVGEDGILSKAQYAKLASEDAAWFENAEMLLVEAYGDVDKIPDMQAWLLDRFNGISNGDTVCVTPYKDGYLIVSGKRMITVDKDMQITSSRENTYLIATGDDWYFEANGTGTCKLTAYKLSLTGTITIPSVVTDKDTGNVYMVTELADDIFNYATQVTKIDFSSSYNLTKIGARAFAFCSNLEINVPDDLPSTITNIGDKAFYSCSKLTGNINTIMNHGYTLGKGVFMKCPNLTGEIQAVFDQNFYLDESGNPVATVVEESQFSGYTGLTGSLTIPSYITEIKANAFYGCTGISELIFENSAEHPSQITTIGDYAFYQTLGMNSNLVLVDSITSIGNYSFAYSGITSLILSNQLNNIGSYAFHYCQMLRGTISFPSTLEIINNEAFSYSGIEGLYFNYDSVNKKGIILLKYNAFTYCINLKNIASSDVTSFPSSLISIENNAFLHCHVLETISLSNFITQIGSSSFNSCYNLNISSWSTNLKTLGSNAFTNCRELTTLPDTTSLIKIDSYAFSGALKLGKTASNGKTNIIEWINNSKITTLGNEVFWKDTYIAGEWDGILKNKDENGIAGQGNVISILGNPFTDSSVTRVATIETDTNINTIEKNAYVGVTSITNVTNNNGIRILTIPSNITTIESYAFSGSTAFDKLIIPKTVTSIASYAFYNCTSIKEIEYAIDSPITVIEHSTFYRTNPSKIVFPNGLKEIKDQAFYNCGGLTSLECPPNLEKIGSSSFAWCSISSIIFNSKLISIGNSAFAGNRYTSIIIPDSVTFLGNNCFYRSPVQTIVFGKGITKIPNYCCGYPLTGDGWQNSGDLRSITIKGTVNEIGDYAFCKNPQLTEIKFSGDGNWEDILKIGTKAFYNCTSLNGNVTLRSNCTLYEDSFENCPLIVTK